MSHKENYVGKTGLTVSIIQLAVLNHLASCGTSSLNVSGVEIGRMNRLCEISWI